MIIKIIQSTKFNSDKKVKNQQVYKLIEGKFSSEESREILQSIFLSKIRFHQMKNFSSKERFGKDDETATVKIPKLNNTLDEILKFIKKAEESGKQFDIKSEITISVVEK